MKLFKLEKGKRITIVARTGSGKSILARALMSRAGMFYVVINPKVSDDFVGGGCVLTSDGLKLEDVKKAIQISGGKGWIDVRPLPHQRNKEIDDFIYELHTKYKNIGLLVDELYAIHTPRGDYGQGLAAWLTRGRSRGQSFIGLTQRPRKIALFCFSEADYIIKMHLNLKDDRMFLSRVTDERLGVNLQTEYAWQFYDIAKNKYTQYAPVPLPRLDRS